MFMGQNRSQLRCSPAAVVAGLVLWAGVVRASDDCINLSPRLCPASKELCRCQRVGDASVICCHVQSEYELKEGLACAGVGRTDVTAVHIRNATLDTLDARWPAWTHLVSLSITESQVSRLMYTFHSVLTCLNLSGNALSEADPSVFTALPDLAMLDLSRNTIEKLPDINVQVPHFWLDISGNRLLQCQNIYSLMSSLHNSSKQLHFRNDQNTFCVTTKSFHWFNSTEVLPIVQLAIQNKLERLCPKGEAYQCRCTAHRIDILPVKSKNHSIHSVNVDCSNQGLTELPALLPPHTIILNISHNNITNLDLLSVDPSYHEIREFYADNNQIDSITVLEGSHFIDHFVSFSIKENRLKSIPTYILSNSFDRSGGQRMVMLGKNRFTCDCSTAQVLKYWLMSNKYKILDYNEVFCENHQEKVIDLDQKKVCTYERDWTDYIYWIIAAEVLLFVLLCGKVSYDYWVFKTAGYLPWPASKMPKMPCDWVFE